MGSGTTNLFIKPHKKTRYTSIRACHHPRWQALSSTTIACDKAAHHNMHQRRIMDSTGLSDKEIIALVVAIALRIL